VLVLGAWINGLAAGKVHRTRIETGVHSTARAPCARCKLKSSAAQRGNRMQPYDPAEIVAQLHQLKLEHRDLDTAIDRLVADRRMDEL